MVSQTGTLHGKERIQQLMEEFPELPRTTVINTDLTREGIKPTEDGRQIGRWALPYAPWYFDYNKEYIYRPEEIGEAYFRTPLCGYFSSGVSFQFMWDSRSPYEIRYEGRGRYQMCRDGEAIEEVFFHPRPAWYDQKTSGGKPMPTVIAIAQTGEYVKLAALTYCGYGDQACRYCNINASESARKDLGMERLITKREQDIYETMVAICHDNTIRTVLMSGGVILDPSKEADMYARDVRTVRRAMQDAGRQLPITIKCQAMEPEDVGKLKEAGADNVGFNVEVWDPKLFEWMCPGKAKYVGRERWLDRLVRSVEVFGRGRVSTSLVLGLEMAQPHGFKTEDEGAASYLEGIEWMLDHQVIGGGALWRCAPGTIFEGQPAPRTEYFLRVQAGRNKLLAQHGWTRSPAQGARQA